MQLTHTPHFGLKLIALSATMALMAVSNPGSASSHSEAPNITRMPQVDATDYYLFRSYEAGRGHYVTMLANYLPLQDPQAGPNYSTMDPTAHYDLHIDNNADGQADLTFRFQFKHELENITIPVNDENGQVATRTIPLKVIGPISSIGSQGAINPNTQNFFESYQLSLIKADSVQSIKNPQNNSNQFAKPMDYIGEQTFGDTDNYEKYAQQFIYEFEVDDCPLPGRVFVGSRQEPFSVDLGNVFDLVNLVPVPKGVLTQFPGGDPGIENDPAKNTIKDYNVTTLAIEYPTQCLTQGDPVIGGWTTASLPTTRTLNALAPFANTETLSNHYTQVSRLGAPLINELIIGIESKDRFNASQPHNDADPNIGFAAEATNPAFPHIVNALFLEAVNLGLGLNSEQSLKTIAPSNAGRGDLVTTFLTGIPGFNKPNNGPNTLSEMIRLNTLFPAIIATAQNPDGAIARNSQGILVADSSGYPNGRRPGDDVVDITLRIAMGAMCVDDMQTLLNAISPNPGFSCSSADAPVGSVSFLDGAPIHATDFQTVFPYFNPPLKGNR